MPSDVVLYYGDVPKRERAWFGAVPATAPTRTLNECVHEQLAPELLRQAARQALQRGLVTKDEPRDVKRALRGFGGLAA